MFPKSEGVLGVLIIRIIQHIGARFGVPCYWKLPNYKGSEGVQVRQNMTHVRPLKFVLLEMVWGRLNFHRQFPLLLQLRNPTRMQM